MRDPHLAPFAEPRVQILCLTVEVPLAAPFISPWNLLHVPSLCDPKFHSGRDPPPDHTQAEVGVWTGASLEVTDGCGDLQYQ